VRWPLVRTFGLAWLVTIPAAAAIAVLALLPWRWLS
jgi:phosphate/sulfate permease